MHLLIHGSHFLLEITKIGPCRSLSFCQKRLKPGILGNFLGSATQKD
ncbi:hypothetical protein C723_0766 [Christiangramia flava JLT2011]|uniref:Uncharacterized protein n=1 Tax=Christiangramia flava JLT2011 TaxID=1229726 RepID=A0A1L7I2X2_9FLAO|nr:hypothetical protein GRFL_1233 [Christiangramia flava JLT2011]OSS40458.1 hypothetical protein C723_0766 [Christiangramia flava JLT2011]